MTRDRVDLTMFLSIFRVPRWEWCVTQTQVADWCCLGGKHTSYWMGTILSNLGPQKQNKQRGRIDKWNKAGQLSWKFQNQKEKQPKSCNKVNKPNWWLKYKPDIENKNHQAGRVVFAVKKVTNRVNNHRKIKINWVKHARSEALLWNPKPGAMKVISMDIETQNVKIHYNYCKLHIF